MSGFCYVTLGEEPDLTSAGWMVRVAYRMYYGNVIAVVFKDFAEKSSFIVGYKVDSDLLTDSK